MQRRGRPPQHLCTATQDEVAAALGITKARVSQLERSALAKLRRWLAARGVDRSWIKDREARTEPDWDL